MRNETQFRKNRMKGLILVVLSLMACKLVPVAPIPAATSTPTPTTTNTPTPIPPTETPSPLPTESAIPYLDPSELILTTSGRIDGMLTYVEADAPAIILKGNLTGGYFASPLAFLSPPLSQKEPAAGIEVLCYQVLSMMPDQALLLASPSPPRVRTSKDGSFSLSLPPGMCMLNTQVIGTPIINEQGNAIVIEVKADMKEGISINAFVPTYVTE